MYIKIIFTYLFSPAINYCFFLLSILLWELLQLYYYYHFRYRYLHANFFLYHLHRAVYANIIHCR